MQLKNFKRLLLSPSVLAVIVAACILFLTLFLTPVIGMADNGDFYRVINGNGLYKLDRGQPDEYLQYFSKEFGVYQYFNEYESSLLSSQTPFIHAAVKLDALFTGNDAVFDIRFLAVMLCLWILVALYLLVDYASYGLDRRYGYLIAAIAVVLFIDTGYTAYFNSFYAEGIVFAGFLTALGCALLIRQNRYNPYVLLGLYMVSGFALVTAKQQNAPLGVLLGLLCIPMLLGLPYKQAERKKRQKRVAAAAVCSFALCTCGIAVYLLIPGEFVDINKYHSMTRGILMTSQNPETALEQFDIDPQYSLLDQSIYYERYPAADVEGEELKAHFYPKYGFISVAGYYLGHPQELLQMVDYAAKNAYSIRPEAIGNYERSAAEEPGAKTSFFTLHSTLKERVVPHTVGFMIIWVAVMLGFSFRDKWRTLVLACAVLMGFSQIGVSIIGAGDADLSKHIFLYNVAFDFTNFIMISTALLHWLATRRQVVLEVPAPHPKEEAVV